MTSDLRNSFIILSRIKNQLVNIMGGLEWTVEQKMKTYNATPSNYMLISNINSAQLALLQYLFTWYNSFVDEYTSHFVSVDPSEAASIALIAEATNNYFSTVESKFPDFKKARNRVLSHGYRNNRKQPLTNREINELYNGLIMHEDLEVFHLLPKAAGLIISEIEKYFTKISESELSLDEAEQTVTEFNIKSGLVNQPG